MTDRMQLPAAATPLRLDGDGRIVSWPESARDLFGRVASSVLGLPLSSLVEPRQRDACENVIAHLRQVAEPAAVHTMALVAERDGGPPFNVECSIWRVQHPGTHAVGFEVLLRDIDHRLQFEQDLREQVRNLRQVSARHLEDLRRIQTQFTDITGTIDEVFWIAAPDISKILYISPAYEKVWQRPSDSLYREPMSFVEAIHPDDRQRVLAGLRVQADGLPIDHEYRIVRPDGVEVWIWDRGYPVVGEGGVVSRYIGVAQDITRRRAIEARLRRQETMDAIGNMAGGLAHDFSNLLGVAIGYLDLAVQDLPASSAARTNVELALDAALRGTTLARRLLTLARREPVQRRVIDLAQAVESMRPLLQHAAGASTLVECHARAAPPVNVDPGALDSALINLAVNARNAMPAGGTLSITVDELAHAAVTPECPLPCGRYALVVVKDTGCGMDEALRAQMGEPFVSTQCPEEGAGLGMAMVHLFARQSGGAVLIQSECGVGTTVQILLPWAGVADQPAPPRARDTMPA